jgi:hypothetical protein
MKTFKQYIEEKLTLSVIEAVQIRDVGEAVAKVDTGNEAFNVLHGTDIEHTEKGVRFKTLHNKILEKPVLKEIEINIGSGNFEQRPVVEIEFTMRGKTYNKPFSIADRSTNDEPVLLGEVFLREIDAVVDVNQQ